ncbi:unnamed protein product [Paramecium pentaurelia]|uniref:Uncharacterized protein n=1 Tax=Paramecium pentaurelia TaxID=43138 RepID=A0A8S1SJZ9_9CILI|nr:unnamed protein product [Paramecium pentaurelia]
MCSQNNHKHLNHHYQSRLQSVTTFNTTQHTGYSTHIMSEAEYDSVPSSAFRGQIQMRSNLHSSRINSPQETHRNARTESNNRLFQQTNSSQQKQLIVNQEKIDSNEVKRRMKFDPQVNPQLIYFKISNISNIGFENYLLQLYKQLILSQILTFDLAIFYHNQTIIMVNYAKQIMDNCRMKSLGYYSLKCNNMRLELNYQKNVYNIHCQITIRIMKMKFTQNLMFVIIILETLKKYTIYLSCLNIIISDILKVFLNMNLNRNYAETINIPLLNQLNLPSQRYIVQEIKNKSLIMINTRTFNKSKTSLQEEGLFLNKTFI